jgi:hypothetical protein
VLAAGLAGRAAEQAGFALHMQPRPGSPAAHPGQRRNLVRADERACAPHLQQCVQFGWLRVASRQEEAILSG